ncbi:MAG: DUF2490 domain-containing protein [Candidatus Omnitrophota bacterium]
MKIKRGFIFICALAAAGLMLSSRALAYGSGDFQYWNTNGIEWKARKDWKVALGEELRFGGAAGELHYQHTDIDAVYSGIAPWLDIKAGYRHIFNKGKKHWEYENAPNFNAIVKFDVWGFKVSDRSRIEYRNIEDKKNNWRYRNQLKARFSLRFEKVEVAPYLADEIFLDCSNRGELTRNRLYSGIELGMFKHIVVDVYYLWQTSKGKSGWVDYNVLGTKLKVSF